MEQEDVDKGQDKTNQQQQKVIEEKTQQNENEMDITSSADENSQPNDNAMDMAKNDKIQGMH